NRTKAGVGKAYMFMIRLKLPGGRLTADQFLAMDDICGRHANGTLRFTTRQSIQFHGVLKAHLKQTIADINSVMVSTLGACGDVNRNVVACPAPLGDPARKQMQELARAVGYNMLVGGGQGMTNSKPDTYPLLAQPVCFLDPDEVVPAAEAVVKLYRDHGNRADRKRARIKYVMHDWGVEKFRRVFAEDYFGKPVRPPVNAPITGLDLHHGWHPQGDGKWFLGLSVENGRLKDDGLMRFRSGVRAVVGRFRASVRITTQQDVLLCDLNPADKPAVDAMLNEYGIPRPENLSLVQKWSLA